MRSRWFQWILIGLAAGLVTLVFLFGLKIGLTLGLLPAIGVMWAMSLFRQGREDKPSHSYKKDKRLRRARRHRKKSNL
jgi:hypothetical protein